MFVNIYMTTRFVGPGCRYPMQSSGLRVPVDMASPEDTDRFWVAGYSGFLSLQYCQNTVVVMRTHVHTAIQCRLLQLHIQVSCRNDILEAGLLDKYISRHQIVELTGLTPAVYDILDRVTCGTFGHACLNQAAPITERICSILESGNCFESHPHCVVI